MKKIFSILLALALVLGLTAMATPTLAQDDECEADVTLSPAACAGGVSQYCIEFEVTVTIRMGTDSFVIDFPAGTGFPDTWTTGDITVESTFVMATAVPKADISVDGTTLTFKNPIPIPASTGSPETVEICITGITNPATEGEYTLTVGWLEGCCDYEELACGEYEIVPLKSSYKFVLDFSKTYDGLNPDFVPPFKACGQPEPYGEPHPTLPGNYTGNFTRFDVILKTDVLGCQGYDPVMVYFELKDAPSESCNATLVLFDGASYYTWVLNLEDDDPVKTWGPSGGFPLAANYTATTPAWVHFNCVGDYEICFWVKPLGTDPCTEEPYPILTERCEVAHVYQWKDVGSLDLDEKWNLISLPLVPFETDIEDVLAAYPYPDDIVSVWYYDAAEGEWYVYGVNTDFQTLTTMEDGKAYWVRTKKVAEGAESTYPEPLWVWGTANKMPPYAPASYDYVAGWNMVGFTSLADDADVEAGYLSAVFAKVAKIYGWNAGVPGSWNEDPTDWYVGQGFWVSFTAAATVFP